MTTSTVYKFQYLPPNGIRCICNTVATSNGYPDGEVEITVTTEIKFNRDEIISDPDYANGLCNSLHKKIIALHEFMTGNTHVIFDFKPPKVSELKDALIFLR
jgi:hypothetical protein